MCGFEANGQCHTFNNFCASQAVAAAVTGLITGATQLAVTRVCDTYAVHLGSAQDREADSENVYVRVA